MLAENMQGIIHIKVDVRLCYVLIYFIFQIDYDRLRLLSYTGSSAFIVVFEATFPTSLKNLEDKWIPELKYIHKNVPRILVCTKSGIIIFCP